MWTEWADEDTACRLERSGEIADDLYALGETTGDPLIRMAGHGTAGIANWHVGEMHGRARELDVAVGLASELPISEAPLGFELELRLMSAAFHLYVHEMIGDVPLGKPVRRAVEGPGGSLCDRHRGRVQCRRRTGGW